VSEINDANAKGLRELKLMNNKAAEKHLKVAESAVEDFKKFWYYNQKELGDLLECPLAFKAITSTFNNLGLMYKKNEKFNLGAMYFKQIL
tara:strand:- start:40 stop:309 length:270 start_codon:yes stop_codon:yes gene_type:complete